MTKRFLLLVCLIFMIYQLERTKAISRKRVNRDMSDFKDIRLDEKGYNKTMQIHYNWYIHSIKALMGEMGKQLMRKLSKAQKIKMIRCLDKIRDRKDIVSAARCLIDGKIAYEEMRLHRVKYDDFMAKKSGEEMVSAVGSTQDGGVAFRQEEMTPTRSSPSTISPNVLKRRKFKQKIDPLKVLKHKNRYKKWMGKFRVVATGEQTGNAKSKTKTKTRKTKTTTVIPRTTVTGRSINLKPFRFKANPEPLKYPMSKMRKMKSRKHKIGKKKMIKMSQEEVERRIQQRLSHFLKYYDRSDEKRSRKMRKKYKKAHRSLLMAQKESELSEMQFRRRVKRSPYRLIADQVQKSDSQKFVVTNLKKMPALLENRISPVQRISKMVINMVRGKNGTERVGGWAKTYEAILSMKKTMDKQAKEPGAKVYDLRMYDLVLGRDTPSEDLFQRANHPEFIGETYGLASRMGGNKNNMKFLSPRIAPVMPDKYGYAHKRQLSPSILSFYKDEAEDQILPLPEILEASGMKGRDQTSMLEMIMEVSGAKDVVNDAMKAVENMKLFGMEGEILEVTKRTMEIFKSLEKSFTGRQQKEMKKRGYTFQLPHQLEKLHEQQGILERKDHGFDYDEYRKQSRLEREKGLWVKIWHIARNGSEVNDNFEHAHQVIGNATALGEAEHRRVKRLTPCNPPCISVPNLLGVLNPTVLAPYAFTPIFGLSVLGPVVLSPSLFSPLILNPAVLSPYVLSPAVGEDEITGIEQRKRTCEKLLP
ncbi:unnamed protein product, partial [Mesorhabditis belari]|uniref:Uncharacterized protein n=1 Tax=Mesorhabditis belari TaxID=2138241 RepID=A0AAF3EFE7_9BILA